MNCDAKFAPLRRIGVEYAARSFLNLPYRALRPLSRVLVLAGRKLGPQTFAFSSRLSSDDPTKNAAIVPVLFEQEQDRTYAKLRWLGAEPKAVQLYGEANVTTPASVLGKSYKNKNQNNTTCPHRSPP